MDSIDFTGRRALVIGGSTGIGNAIARRFHRLGAEVHVTGTRAAASDYGADDLSDMAGLRYARLDLRDRSQLAAWDPGFDTLDALVLCHGHTHWNGAEYDPDLFREVVEVNLNAGFDCAEKFRPLLGSAKGAIVIVSSLAAFRTIYDQPAYTAAKSALLGLVRALSIQYIREGIRVNGIAPGLVETKMGRGHKDFPDLIAKAVRRLPIRRSGEPDEMAGPTVFLCSPLASYMIGQTLIVDGGMSLIS